MIIKHIAIDIGGTLIEPISGDWDVTMCLRDLLVSKNPHMEFKAEMQYIDFKSAKKEWGYNCKLLSREEEYDYFIQVYRTALKSAIEYLTLEDIEKVVHNRVYGEDLYSIIVPFFEYINGIKSVEKGFFSNTYPSVIHFLKSKGMKDEYVNNCLSCAEGLKKPSLPFFERLLQITGIPPSSILIVDDNVMCINMAKKLGFNSVQFNKNTIGKCIKEIENYICI